VHVELVRIDGPLHHGLAEAIGRGDEDDVAEARFGVEGEQHPARAEVTADHLLDGGGKRDAAMLEAVVRPVGDGPVVVEGRKDLPDGLQHVLDAAHVEVGLLLPGEGRFREVLGGRRRAHRE
jgi:hypothetical protein